MKHAVDSTRAVCLRDNVWGPQEEDAVRRDFTINAMYYDPQTQIVVDYHNGFKDVKNRVIRMIGDPATRYREDPVRIIRAVRFAAKLSNLGFALEPKTAAPLVKSQELLADVPQSRLFDEMLKLLQTGHSWRPSSS
jgi:poly(A) polymerase